MTHEHGLWVYLSASPLLWLTLSLLAWLVADWVSRRTGRHPLANPVLLSIAAMALVLAATGTPYARFFEGAQFMHLLLGPATVALAVPLIRQWSSVRRNLVPMACALSAGSVTAALSAIALGHVVGLPPEAVASLAPKSVTAGVAMAISAGLGGDPALTAALVITTGIIGAVTVTPLMNAMGVTDYAARGFAVGLTSHGIGTARAYSVDPTAGLFAGMAMALNAVVTSLLVPLLL
jgi:predicted murein hydrolase (TIGR00659 family)